MKNKLYYSMGAALCLLVTFGGTHAASAQSERIVFYGPVTETYGKGRNATTETHNQILSMNVDGTDVRQLTSGREDCYFPTWSPDRSHVLFHRGGTIGYGGGIYIMDSDGGGEFRVADADQVSADWSPDGTMVCYVGYPESSPGPRGLWVVSVDPLAKGKKAVKVGTPVLLAEGHFYGPTWSPDGTRIAYHSPATGEISVLDLTTGIENRLESMGGMLPSWSPTGDQIAFVSSANSTYTQLYIMDADFSNVTQLTDYTDSSVYWPSWSDDSTQVAFRLSLREGAGVLTYDIYKMTLATGELTLLQERADHPDWTP